MKAVISILLLTITLSVHAQQSFGEKDAAAIIAIFFDGFHEGDTLKMKSVMAKNMRLQRAFMTKEGNNIVTENDGMMIVNAVAKRPADQKWNEKLLGYRYTRDGNLAHMWVPYEFYLNGQFSHCGANSFTLAKFDNGWKIVHLADSRRRGSCKAAQPAKEEQPKQDDGDGN